MAHIRSTEGLLHPQRMPVEFNTFVVSFRR
jgi:hypothetical protein